MLWITDAWECDEDCPDDEKQPCEPLCWPQLKEELQPLPDWAELPPNQLLLPQLLDCQPLQDEKALLQDAMICLMEEE